MKRLSRAAAFVALLLLVSFASCVGQEHELKGAVKGEVAIEPGRYVIRGTLLIEPGAKFVIPAGTEVRFAPGSSVIVEGRFLIRAQANKRVVLTFQNSKGIFVGPGFSKSTRIVRDASLRLENCDFKGNWGKTLVTARSSIIDILKCRFKNSENGILNAEACSARLEANSFRDVAFSERAIRAQGSGSIVFIDNRFSDCTFHRDSIILDGRDFIFFNKNTLKKCVFPESKGAIILGKCGTVDFLDNCIIDCETAYPNTEMFVLDSYSALGIRRNLFKSNTNKSGNSDFLRYRAHSSNVFGNRFEGNTGFTLLRAAANTVIFDTNWIYYNKSRQSLLWICGRKGIGGAKLELLNCKFKQNIVPVYFSIIGFPEAVIHTNLFIGPDKAEGLDKFIHSIGNTSLAFHANDCRNLSWAKLICVNLATSYEVKWADSGNLIPPTALVEVSLSQNEVKYSRFSFVTENYISESPAVSWRVMSNKFAQSDLSNLLTGSQAMVSGVFRFNKFVHCDEILFSQGEGGGRTIVDRNQFFDCPRFVLLSRTNNPSVDFKIIANSFETRGKGCVIKKNGEIFFYGNFFQDAVRFE